MARDGVLILFMAGRGSGKKEEGDQGRWTKDHGTEYQMSEGGSQNGGEPQGMEKQATNGFAPLMNRSLIEISEDEGT